MKGKVADTMGNNPMNSKAAQQSTYHQAQPMKRTAQHMGPQTKVSLPAKDNPKTV